MRIETKTTISDILIAMLFSGKSVKNFKSIIREQKIKRYKESSVRVALTRLNKNGYINNSEDGWEINDKGKKYFNMTSQFSYIPSPFNDKYSSDTIVSFDIPGPSRKTRDWLRNQLKIFNYKMLQQSLWIGPGPLPIEFIKRLSLLKIKENIKIFKISK